MKYRNRNVLTVLVMLHFAMMLLTVPLRWLTASLVAAAIHELGHYLALFFSGADVRSFRIRPFGAQMESTPLTSWKQLFCQLAGPVGGLAGVLLWRWMPRVAVCGLLQSAFNLIPIWPLDGGKILRYVLHMVRLNPRLCRIMEYTVCLIFILLVVWISLHKRLGILPIIFLCYILLQSDLVKTPCKLHTDWI